MPQSVIHDQAVAAQLSILFKVPKEKETTVCLYLHDLPTCIASDCMQPLPMLSLSQHQWP